MASKSSLKLTAIEEYFGKFDRFATTRGENHLESGHLRSFTYDPDTQSVVAKVLPSKRDDIYTVEMNFSRTKIFSATCQCVRSQSVCSHMGAVALHINKNLSVTDTACTWAVPRLKREKNLHPIPCNDFQALSTVPPREELRSHFYDDERLKGASLSAHWLLKPEPERNNNATLSIVHPTDVIFTEEFNTASCKRTFLDEQLGIYWDTTVKVAELTKGQTCNPLWTQMRELRITASKFGDVLAIYKRPIHLQKPSKTLLSTLHKPANLEKVKAAEWGRTHEDIAISQFTNNYKTEVKKTGLWLDGCGYLGGSPDGLIGKEGVCEVKCPFSLREEDLNEVLTPGPKRFIFQQDGAWVCNVNHEYYHQIQGQMYFTKRSYCTFLAWTPKSLVVRRINADPQWPVINVPKLKNFYAYEFIPYVQRTVLTTG